MKDTRGEGGHAGHHRNKRALTDPSLHHHRHRSSPHTLTSTQNNPRLRPSRTHAFVVRDSRGSVEVRRGRGLHGLLIEWVHWGSMWRSGASPGAEAELRAARKSRKARRENAGRTLWKRFLHLYRDEFTVAAAQVPIKTQKTWTRHSDSRPLQSSGWTPN